jgi:hypothetical protein
MGIPAAGAHRVIMSLRASPPATIAQYYTRVISFSLHRHLRLPTTHFHLHHHRSLAR